MLKLVQHDSVLNRLVKQLEQADQKCLYRESKLLFYSHRQHKSVSIFLATFPGLRIIHAYFTGTCL